MKTASCNSKKKKSEDFLFPLSLPGEIKISTEGMTIFIYFQSARSLKVAKMFHLFRFYPVSERAQ